MVQVLSELMVAHLGARQNTFTDTTVYVKLTSSYYEPRVAARRAFVSQMTTRASEAIHIYPFGRVMQRSIPALKHETVFPAHGLLSNSNF